MTEFRQSHFIFLTTPRLLLLFLLVPSFSYGAGAQSPTQPIPLFASQHQNWDPSIIIVAGSLVFVLFVLGVLSIFFRTCSETVDYERNPFGGGATRDWPCSCSQGIEKGVIDTFPILVYSSIKDLKIGKEALECAVCLSEFHDMDRLRLLPKCNHVFHPGCIDAWFISHVTCPVCRGNLNTDSGEVEISVLTQSNDDVLGQENGSSRAEIRETEQQTVMSNVKEEQRITINEDETTIKQNLSPKSRKFRKLSKSNSTGHSLIEPEANMERYTLRLHEDLRTYILLNHGCASQHVLGNRKKGFFWGDSDGSSRSTRDNIEESGRGERQERRVFSMNPPFVSWGWGSVTANSSNTGFEK